MVRRSFFTVDTAKGKITGTAVHLVSGVETITDLSDANISTRELIITKPSGGESTVTLTISNPPGTDGVFEYEFPSTFDEAGWWEVQTKITYTDGRIRISSPPTRFQVEN
jgi:hypothetical protein